MPSAADTTPTTLGQSSLSLLDHPDNRGVFIELWTIDLVGGDLAVALLFSQLLWWHQVAKDGRSRLTFERDGFRWLVRPDDAWEDECRLTTKQVRRIRSALVAAGLVAVRRFKVNGAPTSAWRPLHDAIQEQADRIRPLPEVPRKGQFHGSTPQGAVPSTPQGAVPIPLQTTVKTPREDPSSVDLVFAAWLDSTKKTARTVLDAKRRSLISAALKTHPLDDVVDAVRGWEHSPYHRGENPDRRRYNDLGLLLRDAEHIERFRDLARGPHITRSQPTNSRPAYRPQVIDNDRSGPSRVLTEDDL